MRNFNSSLLKSMPARAKPARSRSVPKRILLILIFTAFIGAPIFIIATRILPGNGAGHVFYWIHDHIFLPIKGYTYTLFYPYSLGWWGPLLTIIILWLIAYLTMVSFFKDPHIYFLRKVVRRNSRHHILVKTGKWLKKLKMEPLLLREVASQERKKALNRLIAVPLSQVNESETACKRVVHLTLLHIRFFTLPAAGREDYFEAVFSWHQAYLQVRARQQKNPGSDGLKKLTAQLAAQVETFIPHLLNYKDKNQLEDAVEKNPGFDVSSVVLDLLYLASLNNSNLAEKLLDTSTAANSKALKKAVASRLIASVTARQALLDETRTRVEKIRKQEIDPLTVIDSKAFWPFLPDDKNKAFLPVIVQMGLSIALDLAVLVDNISIGLGYMESMEIFDFELNCLDPEILEAVPVLPLNQLPGPGDYRLCAELAEAEIEEYEQAWQESSIGEDGAIIPGDFELARTRVRALYHAAGPDFDVPG